MLLSTGLNSALTSRLEKMVSIASHVPRLNEMSLWSVYHPGLWDTAHKDHGKSCLNAAPQKAWKCGAWIRFFPSYTHWSYCFIMTLYIYNYRIFLLVACFWSGFYSEVGPAGRSGRDVHVHIVPPGGVAAVLHLQPVSVCWFSEFHGGQWSRKRLNKEHKDRLSSQSVVRDF